MNDIMEHVCPHCVDRIKKYGSPCYFLLESALEAYLEDQILVFDEDDFNDIFNKSPSAFLERKGYILTTEIDKSLIAVTPSAEPWNYENGEFGFCWCFKTLQ